MLKLFFISTCIMCHIIMLVPHFVPQDRRFTNTHDYYCNRVHLHIVFVLLYSVCRSCLCSFVCVRHSIFYVCVACCDLDVTIRLRERAREKASRIQPLACTIRQERRNKIRSLWLWFVCYSLLPSCYFHRLFTLL